MADSGDNEGAERFARTGSVSSRYNTQQMRGMVQRKKRRMLTRLRFKNWRSLKDVTIDLSPITVFIGANSSGKTNIVDALYFFREALELNVQEAVFRRQGIEKIRTLGSDSTMPVELEFSYESQEMITYTLSLQENRSREIQLYTEQLTDSQGVLMRSIDGAPELRSDNGKISYPEVDFFRTALAEFANVNYPTLRNLFQFVTQRWQMLDENFMPPLKAEAVATLDTIDRYATNLLFILNYMGLVHRSLYNKLQDDLKWILGYVDKLETEHKDFDLRMVIKETEHPDQEAPTISAGTKRLVAMLTAFYALDMRSSDMPGLVVIEEPDTALNPGILENFVEQLRTYVEGDKPRQVIMTTHNPRFLDYFKPEEVRVVERDEQGYTSVHHLPDHIREVWLDKYTLGEVWMTRSLGGLPE